MAKAGAGRYRVGEHLWVADPPRVAEVIVRKSTGQTPDPEFLSVEFLDGRKFDRVHPSDLYRSRQTAFLLVQAYQRYYTVKSKPDSSLALLEAGMELANAQAAAAIGHPYRPTYELTLWTRQRARWIRRTFLPPN